MKVIKTRPIAITADCLQGILASLGSRLKKKTARTELSKYGAKPESDLSSQLLGTAHTNLEGLRYLFYFRGFFSAEIALAVW